MNGWMDRGRDEYMSVSWSTSLILMIICSFFPVNFLNHYRYWMLCLAKHHWARKNLRRAMCMTRFRPFHLNQYHAHFLLYLKTKNITTNWYVNTILLKHKNSSVLSSVRTKLCFEYNMYWISVI